jgi:hypothetical protein
MRFRLILLTAVAMAALALAAPVLAANAPPGYQRLRSDLIPAPHGMFDTGAQISCPTGKVIWGGGVSFFNGFEAAGQTINTTAPLGTTGWRARYNNDTNRDIVIVIDAICANKPRNYSIQFANAANPAHTQSNATAICPVNTVLLSGGVFSTSDVASVFMLQAFPLTERKYRAVMWNGSDRNEQMSSFAICGHRPAKYVITTQTGSDTGGPNSVLVGGSQCPTGTQVTGGGVKVVGPNPLVSPDSMLDEPSMQWQAGVFNSTPNPVTATWFAICAGG